MSPFYAIKSLFKISIDFCTNWNKFVVGQLIHIIFYQLLRILKDKSQQDLYLLGIVAKQEGKMVLWSAQILEYVKVHTMPLNWRKERSHGQLGATLTLLGKMCRRK